MSDCPEGQALCIANFVVSIPPCVSARWGCGAVRFCRKGPLFVVGSHPMPAPAARHIYRRTLQSLLHAPVSVESTKSLRLCQESLGQQDLQKVSAVSANGATPLPFSGSSARVPERDQTPNAQDQHMAALLKIKSNPTQLIDLDPN